MQTWNKPIGTVSLSFGTVRVVADSAQAYNWATRAGQTWPCSAIRYMDRVCAELASNGDLVDLTVNGDASNLMADELTAWIDDNLADTPFAHLARNQ